ACFGSAGNVDRRSEMDGGKYVPVQMAVGEAGKHRKTVVLCEPKSFLLPGKKVSDRAVAADDPLRFARRAGGEGDVRGVVGIDCNTRLSAWDGRKTLQQFALCCGNDHSATRI